MYSTPFLRLKAQIETQILTHQKLHISLCIFQQQKQDYYYAVFDEPSIKERFNPFTPKSAKLKIQEYIVNFILKNCQQQTAPPETTAQ